MKKLKMTEIDYSKLSDLDVYEACFLLQQMPLDARPRVFFYFAPKVQELLEKYCLCNSVYNMRFKPHFRLPSFL